MYDKQRIKNNKCLNVRVSEFVFQNTYKTLSTKPRQRLILLFIQELQILRVNVKIDCFLHETTILSKMFVVARRPHLMEQALRTITTLSIRIMFIVPQCSSPTTDERLKSSNKRALGKRWPAGSRLECKLPPIH